MRSRSSRTRTTPPPPNKSGDYSSISSQQQENCYEGERLASLLKSMEREIELARLSDTGVLIPEKLWLKQQFSIGVNEVTRVLERMPPQISDETECSPTTTTTSNDTIPPSSVQKLQVDDYFGLTAIIVALDCNPRWLTKHLLIGLASSRGVPIIFLKDKKSASLRLGQLVKLKTAVAIGVKARANGINQFVDKMLLGNDIQFDLEA